MICLNRDGENTRNIVFEFYSTLGSNKWVKPTFRRLGDIYFCCLVAARLVDGFLSYKLILVVLL